MKSANRKVLMTLLGVMIATPFMVIASMVVVSTFAETARADLLFVGLMLASVAVRIIDGQLANRTAQTEQDHEKQDGNMDLHESSTVGA
jgi:hypothetical protein